MYVSLFLFSFTRYRAPPLYVLGGGGGGVAGAGGRAWAEGGLGGWWGAWVAHGVDGGEFGKCDGAQGGGRWCRRDYGISQRRLQTHLPTPAGKSQ